MFRDGNSPGAHTYTQHIQSFLSVYVFVLSLSLHRSTETATHRIPAKNTHHMKPTTPQTISPTSSTPDDPRPPPPIEQDETEEMGKRGKGGGREGSAVQEGGRGHRRHGRCEMMSCV
jgi:hypothetical protein